jgi:outer membrane biosynthesis protein TonB
MYHPSIMQAQFEAEKNRKALTYTIIICIILLLLTLFIRWQIPQPPTPIIQDLIEVNLGNDNEGYGKVQPLIKGEMNNAPSPVQQQQKTSAAHDEPAKDIQPDEDEDKNAAPVIKPVKTNPKAANLLKQPTTKPVKTNNPAPVLQPAPKPQKPIATYNGPGNGKGNGATEDNSYRNQGNNPNGRGDAGSPAGKPDSYGNDPGGKTGVSISNGLKGRRISHFPSFQDDFSENAKVYVDVDVDASGNVTDASVAKGTTTSNTTIRSIALQKAKQLKFNAGEEDNGTIIFNFKVQD